MKMDRKHEVAILVSFIGAVILAVILQSCTTPTKEYLAVPLDAPAMPELPVVNREEFKQVNNQLCITPDAYKRLAVRDKILREQVRVLTAIIQSTQPGQ